MPQLDLREFRFTLAALALAAAACAALGPLSWAQAIESRSDTMTPLYKRAAATVEDRVADLLARMTIEEKVEQIDGRGIVVLPSARVEKQKRGPANASRLAIPVLFHAAPAPGFAQGIALAATWDTDLVRDVHAVVAGDASARGARLFIGPSLDVARDPRRGRIQETFGEDPHLVAALGVAAIEGLQGTQRSLAPGKVLAAATHLAGHGLPDENTGVGPAPIAPRELRENFLPPFEDAIRKAGLAAIVASRGELDSVPAHANAWLLTQVLRKEWDFAGVAFADAGGVEELQTVHRVAQSPADAAVLALAAGIDVAGAPGKSFATLSGRVRTDPALLARIDAATARVLALKFRAGIFDAPPVDAVKAPGKAASGALALKAAQRAITLLKNDGTLPLAPTRESPVKIALVESGGTSLAGGLRAAARGRAEVVVVEPGLDGMKSASVIVLALGDANTGSEDLLLAAKSLRKPVIVVMTGHRPSASIALADGANALVAAWALGEQGGKAIAAVLFGDVNPGGKLPVTIARNAGQLPTFYNVKPSARRGYLFETSEPLYAFGWGLSYTTFEVGAPRLSSATMAADGTVRVSVDVRNSGKRAGDETVQLYIHDKVSTVTRPVKELRAFQRVSLAAGESRTVEFALPAQSLALWDENLRRVVEPGEFEIMAGANSTQLKGVTLTVTGGPAR